MYKRQGEGEFLCASDTPALAGFTRTILPMEDGEVALLSPLGVELYDAAGARQQRMPTQLSGVDHVADKREFRHFMLKEIHEQPETAELWVARHLPQGLPLEQPVALPMDVAFYAGIERIQILACGTSRHAAMVGAYLLEQFAGIPASVHYASEFRYAPPPLAPHTLTIGVTQSGETADTLAALAMEAQRRLAHGDPAFAPRQLGVTNRPESSLSRQVPHILDIGAGIEVGVAATKTFLGQLLAFYGLAMAFASHRDALCQVAGLIYIQAAMGGDVIAQQLHRHHGEQGANPLIHRGHRQQFIKQIGVRPLGGNTDQLSITGLGFLGVAEHLLEHRTGYGD